MRGTSASVAACRPVKSHGPVAPAGRAPPTAARRPDAVAQSGVSRAGVLVREDREGGDDSGLVSRGEDASERERRHDVAVRDDEVLGEEAALGRAPDAAGRPEDLLLERPVDGNVRVGVPDRRAERGREVVRVHDEAVRPFLEEMVEDVEEDGPAAERGGAAWAS